MTQRAEDLERAIVDALAAGESRVVVPPTPGAYLAFSIARLAGSGRFARPLVVVTADERRATTLRDDLSFFLGDRAGPPGEALELSEATLLPSIEATPYAEMSPDRGAIMRRMALLARLRRGFPGSVLICSAAALRRRVVSPEIFAALSLRIAVGEEVGRERLVETLVAGGHARAPVVDDPGTFAIRGGIVDVFSPLSRFPVRVEFFDDLVETVRLFDPVSQRTLRSIDAVELFPVRETVRAPGIDPKERLYALADALSYPTRQTRAVLEALATERDFLGIEALTPAFHRELVPLGRYLPETQRGSEAQRSGDPRDALWIVEDPDAVAGALFDEDARTLEAYESRRAAGKLAFPPEAFFLSAGVLGRELQGRLRIEVRAGEETSATSAPVVTSDVRDNAEVVADLKRARAERGELILQGLIQRLEAWVGEGVSVVVAAGSVADAERLEALLVAHLAESPSSTRDALTIHGASRDASADVLALLEGCRGGGVHLLAGRLSAGFQRPGRLVLLSHDEIFGARVTRRPSRRRVGAGLGDLGQIAEGDHVVHAEHGIGAYRGLVQLALDGIGADFLLLEYAGGDKLYLPVHRMSQVAKYVGADGTRPRLDRLGGVTWQKKKKKVTADLRRFSEELLQLYSQRAALEGYAHPEPGPEYEDFVASFPFTETDDQARAIDEVLADLGHDRPMDRLVCGDVGFGKTEVALRAAFVVAFAGRQVALLAPTTVLVEQHLRTFKERMGAYPLRVEAVSRFRKPQKLRHVLADLAAGKVDVVIGTHRLLSQDVSFKKLGLLVIDEEQRFGVKHKEALKRLRTQVDVLTMTATPIPRTLQLSMVGLREISIIATPPADRLAIRTVTCAYDEALVAEAIRRELARGGQVFFVHNEVSTIDAWAARVAALVPEARVIVGHGQMDSRRLERVMLTFVRGEADVLVSTTIIESGLDIARANTMFINRADHFGLSQLYQLRGRIGRSQDRATCYLLVPGMAALSEDARKRLEILAQFSQLGGGFSVASYDLELRGAGDLLGAKQSGHIAALGFEAYARLLEEAVAELRGEPIVRETDPDLKVALPAFIPDDYVEDMGQRLEIYKRLSDACRDEVALAAIFDELRDRYGAPPEEVEALIEVMVLKGLGVRLGATLLDLGATRMTVRFSEATPLPPERLIALVSDPGRGYKLTPDARLTYTLGQEEHAQPLVAAKKVLRDLLLHVNPEH